MKLPPINPIKAFVTSHDDANDTNDSASAPTLSRKLDSIESAGPRPQTDAGNTRPSRLLYHLAQMRRSDSSDGGNWSEAGSLPPGQTATLGQIDRCLTGVHAVTTLLHAAECGRSHEDGASELGDDLSIGLLFAARELVSTARESLSRFHARCAGEPVHPAA